MVHSGRTHMTAWPMLGVFRRRWLAGSNWPGVPWVPVSGLHGVAGRTWGSRQCLLRQATPLPPIFLSSPIQDLTKPLFTLNISKSGLLHLSHERPTPYPWLWRCFFGCFYTTIFVANLFSAMENHSLIILFAFLVVFITISPCRAQYMSLIIHFIMLDGFCGTMHLLPVLVVLAKRQRFSRWMWWIEPRRYIHHDVVKGDVWHTSP